MSFTAGNKYVVKERQSHITLPETRTTADAVTVLINPRNRLAGVFVCCQIWISRGHCLFFPKTLIPGHHFSTLVSLKMSPVPKSSSQYRKQHAGSVHRNRLEVQSEKSHTRNVIKKAYGLLLACRTANTPMMSVSFIMRSEAL